jgi:hypothetical protein
MARKPVVKVSRQDYDYLTKMGLVQVGTVYQITKDTILVNILGTNYEIVFSSDTDKYPELKQNDGFTCYRRKLIVVDSNDEFVREHILRHEIVHAFLNESGLNTQSWADNEEIVDWIALQFDKIGGAFNEIRSKLQN